MKTYKIIRVERNFTTILYQQTDNPPQERDEQFDKITVILVSLNEFKL